MLRRLYFVIPDESQAMQVVADLETVGVDRNHVHALPGRGATLTHLPLATERQRRDNVWHLESSVWAVNMALFGLALLGLLASLYLRSLAGAAAAATIMAVTLLAGVWFAVCVPDTHLDEFRGVLSHSEILLMVDVPKAKVFDVEEIIRRRHPEAVMGGAGWTFERLGI